MDGRNDVLPSEDQINADFASHPTADSLCNKEITVPCIVSRVIAFSQSKT